MFLVLHGQTDLNVAKRAQARRDSPLTVKGVAEGRAVGRKLRTLLSGIDPTIISSPLGRCRATACLIASSLGLAPDEIMTDDRLSEVNLGSWEGLNQAEIRRGWPKEMEGATEYDWYFRAPGGEGYAEVAERMRGWLGDLSEHDYLVVVGHGVSSRVLRGVYARLLPEDAMQLDVDRDAVFLLQENGFSKIPAR